MASAADDAASAADAASATDGAGAEKPLYGRLMRAIHTRHSIANAIRFFKLPLIFTDVRLWAGAIAQFWWLTRTLEERLRALSDDPLVAHVAATGLKDLAPGYEADLAQILGPDWREEAEAALTAATRRYAAELEAADARRAVAAAFILYGALVVGGGRATQQKAKRVFPSCDHELFDVADDMRLARRRFKNCFTAIGKDHAGAKAVAPEAADDVVAAAAHFMGRNNEVVLSVRVVPYWWWKAAIVAAVGVVASRRLRGAR